MESDDGPASPGGGRETGDSVRADLVFHALADATRRDIVAVALRSPCSVSALARRYPMSVTAVQKHVNVLERAGLVGKHRRGREQIVVGDNAPLAHARDLLNQLEDLWRGRLDRFAEVLDDPDPAESPRAESPRARTESGGIQP